MRSAFPESVIANEVILYNLIPFAALITTIAAPSFNNLLVTVSISLAITFWLATSLLSTLSQYLQPIPDRDQYLNFGYMLFYPLVLIALYRPKDMRRPLARSEFIDLALLFFIVFSSFVILILPRSESGLMRIGYENYTHTFYLFFDAAFLIWVFRIVIIDGLTIRNIILALGLLLFLASDLAFIWRSAVDNYVIGQIIDLGWVAGITLIASALWCDDGKEERAQSLYPFTLVLSLLISVSLLALLALRDGEVSAFIAIPAFLALILASARITSFIRKSHRLSDESNLAHIDELTGLANRRKIIAELSTFGENEGAFLLLDLDGFKPINDQYGHGAGDQLLQEIAERFTRALPTSAVVARLGGDEFGIIVKGSYEETLEGAYALRATLSYPFTISGQKISVGVSIGYVQNDGRGDLLKRADIAMYQAKNSAERLVQS